MQSTYKIVIIGPAKSGKTALLRRLRGLDLDGKYLATIGVEVHTVKFTIDYPRGSNTEICLIVWDCAGDEKFKGLGDGYYTGADLAIILFKTQTDRQQSIIDYKRVRNTRVLNIQADTAYEMSIPDLQMEICRKLQVKGGIIPVKVLSSKTNNEELPLEQESNEIDKLKETIKNQEKQIKELERLLLIKNEQITANLEGIRISDRRYSDLVTMLQSILKFAK